MHLFGCFCMITDYSMVVLYVMEHLPIEVIDNILLDLELLEMW